MNGSRASRLIAGLLCSAALVVGTASVPAAASPSDEALYLSAMKAAWSDLPGKDQRITCKAYRIAPRKMITSSVDQVWQDDASRDALSKPAWRRVVTAYLEWACPGGRPR
ncbi:MAG: hypothetical protein Q8M17_00180 [Actinomycetota bacterium]|nr:hypothetical protein [Actinomycetota bacterium]